MPKFSPISGSLVMSCLSLDTNTLLITQHYRYSDPIVPSRLITWSGFSLPSLGTNDQKPSLPLSPTAGSGVSRVVLGGVGMRRSAFSQPASACALSLPQPLSRDCSKSDRTPPSKEALAPTPNPPLSRSWLPRTLCGLPCIFSGMPPSAIRLEASRGDALTIMP